MRKTQWWLFSFRSRFYLFKVHVKMCFLILKRRTKIEPKTSQWMGVEMFLLFSFHEILQWHRAAFTQFSQFLLFLLSGVASVWEVLFSFEYQITSNCKSHSSALLISCQRATTNGRAIFNSISPTRLSCNLSAWSTAKNAQIWSERQISIL